MRYPIIIYNEDGDQLEIYLNGTNYYGKYVSASLTLLLSQEDDSVIGMYITDLRNTLGCLGYKITDIKIND